MSEFAYWRIFSYISAMKRHRLLIIPLMHVVMTSCRRERSIDGYPFSPATGNALFDSLTACVWSGFDNDMPAAAIKPLVDRADSVSRRHREKQEPPSVALILTIYCTSLFYTNLITQ